MGLFDFLKTRQSSASQPAKELTLTQLTVGCLVDYDMTTWEVTSCNRYDWGDDDVSREWQLTSADTVAYLELEQDDEAAWSLNYKINFSRLDPNVKRQIMESGDPPEEIIHEGQPFYLEETAAGHFSSDLKSTPQPVLRWSYMDESGQKYLGIEQWAETDFDASVGIPVYPYQFTNLLPPP